MTILKKLWFAALTFALFGTPASSATYYSDLTRFQSVLATTETDSFDGIDRFLQSGIISRPTFSFSVNRIYGCVNHSFCGNNSALGFDNAYFWTYQSGRPITFTFDTPVRAFGFRFGSTTGRLPSHAILDGVTSVATSGFFGVVYDTARTTFTTFQTESTALLDDITTGNGFAAPPPAPAPIPVPGSGGLLLIALAAAYRLGRKRIA